MHIAEGVLSPAVLLTGYALTAAGTAVGLRRLDYDRLMTVAILAAAFFVGSLSHVPIGPSSAHL
uniref:energy-coupling factor ABC transporter permease n=1 Tax=Desulfovibrio legallii TaxID=571438 RepID=UPI003A951F43